MTTTAPTRTAQSALLAGPRPTFGRHYCERWIKGPEGDRRVRVLRAAGLAVTTRTVRDIQKLWNGLGADRHTVLVTEIDYSIPAGWAGPPAI